MTSFTRRNLPIAIALGTAAALATFIAAKAETAPAPAEAGCIYATGRILQSSWRITWPSASGDFAVLSTSRPSAAPLVTRTACPPEARR
jgi:hypothetical protein